MIKIGFLLFDFWIKENLNNIVMKFRILIKLILFVIKLIMVWDCEILLKDEYFKMKLKWIKY